MSTVDTQKHDKINDIRDVLREALTISAEIAHARDVEEILRLVVRRTRHLLRSDMAYVSLNDDETNETFICQSDGVATAAYRGIRMPVGTGILGQVASGLAPYQTQSYVQDTELPHIPEIDEIVTGEGVETVMGVPLLVGSKVLGALMVAERYPRVFSPAQLDIVETFGKHVAAAINSAEQFSSLSEQNRLLRREAANSLFASRLREKLAQAPSAEHLTLFTAQELNLPLSLYDGAGEPISTPENADRMSGRYLADLMDWPDSTREETERVQTLELESGTFTICLPQQPHRQIFSGFFAVPQKLDDHQHRFLAISMDNLVIGALISDARDQSQRHQDSDLIQKILMNNQLDNQFRRILESRGITSTSKIYVAVLHVSPKHQHHFEKIVRSAPETKIFGTQTDHYTVIFSNPRILRRIEDETSQLHRNIQYSGAYTGPVNIDDELKAHILQARAGMLTMKNSGRPGIINADQVGILGQLLFREHNNTSDLLTPIRPLLDYDNAHTSELSQTALTYFENDQRIDLTAQTLFIHRNTVKQRLARISDVLGKDWNRSPRGIDIHWSLRTWSWTQQPSETTR